MNDLRTPPINLVELFAGAGGLALGFERAGSYQTVALYDTFKPAKDSYKGYRPHAIYRTLDVTCLKSKSVLNDLCGRRLHGLLGGPPCQGFSMAGKRQAEADINKLVKAYGRVVDRLRPTFLIMENVPQLLFHKFFPALLKDLERHYYVTYGILNAARYGTPQTRNRLFLLAYDRSFGIQPTLPQPTHGQLGQELYAYHLSDTSARLHLNDKTADAIFGADPVVTRVIKEQRASVDAGIHEWLEPLVTVGDAISDLPSTMEENSPLEYASPPATCYQRQLRSDWGRVSNCTARKHVGKPLEIALKLREGGTPSLEPGFIDKRYYSQAYARLHRAGLARTLTTFFQNAGSGRFLHYEQPRTLTVREAARLQGFSDDYIFVGTLADQMQLVGNAVPLPLAEALSRHVLKEIGEHLI